MSCVPEGGNTDPGNVDSLKAVIEGYVQPMDEAATLVLSRGDTVATVHSQQGYFKFKDIDFGLYLLEIKAEGYGGLMRTLSVDRTLILMDEIHLDRLPWPLARMYPRDSLVFRTRFQDSIVLLQFAQFMDHASVEAALTLNPAVGYRAEWNRSFDRETLGDNLTIVFSPTLMEFGRTYHLTLGTGAKTVNGAPLERSLDFPLVRRVPLLSEGDLAGFLDRTNTQPLDTILVKFSEPMDIASVPGRLGISPASPYQVQWDPAGTLMRIIPATRWPPGGDITVTLKQGYRAKAGKVGGDISQSFPVAPFLGFYGSSGTVIEIEDELEIQFNLPIDFSSLRHSVDAPASVQAALAAPNRILWSFSDTRVAVPFTLRIHELRSIFGDTLVIPGELRMVVWRQPGMRIDSMQADHGLRPGRDTLRMNGSWTLYQRLKTASWSTEPSYPFAFRWNALQVGEDVGLTFWFLQPVPAGTAFKLLPKIAKPGDTLSFKTEGFAGRFLRPFHGEEKVRVGDSLVIEWNTWPDTAGFAAKVAVAPPVDSLRVAQYLEGGMPRTVIRHGGFARNQEYQVKVTGVTDLFSRPLGDSLGVRFRSAP